MASFKSVASFSYALGLSVYMVTVTGGARAAEAPAEPAAGDGLEEIIVTSQRRAERLRDVGMSVVAASGDSLVEKGIMDIEDLTRIVPGLTATDTPYGSPVLTMRGVGFYESALAGSSPVAAYIDEIPIPYTRMASGAGLDVQRVEVSKGPQGTLYGQNSTGGAINYVTNKPTHEFRAGANVTFGRFNDLDAQGFVSGPVSDMLGVRVAVRSHYSSAWQRSVSRDDALGAARFSTARLIVDFHPTSDLTFELNVNGFMDKSDTQAVQATSFFPNVPATVQPIERAVVFTPPGDDRLADWNPGQQFRRNNYDLQEAVKATYALTDTADIISITANNRYRQNQYIDSDGTFAEAAQTTQDGYINSFSQELRLQGSFDKLKYVVGGNYSKDNIYDNSIYVVGDSSQAHSVPGFPFRLNRTHSHQHADTYAAFTDGTYQLSDQLSVDAGVRYTKQNRDFSGCDGDPGPIDGGAWAKLFSFVYGRNIPVGACTTLNPTTGVIGLVTDNLDQSNVSWRTVINYKITPDAMVYANVSRGYKAGSFSTVGGVVSTQYTPAKQEAILAYEVGSKLGLLGARLELDSAVYYYDYTDKQFRGKILDRFFGSIEKLYNVPKSNIKGAEVQLIARPVAALTLNANVTFTQSKITSDFPSLNPLGQAINLRGESFELTPKWAAAAGALYDTAISGSVNGFVGLNATYQTRTHGGYGDLPIFRIDPYALVDANLGIRDASDRWRAEIWGRNLFDKYYWTNANYFADFTYRLAGRPRTYGVSVSYRY